MTVFESITIVLPLPPACLSPNRPTGSVGGRMKRAAASKRYRRLARQATEAERIETGPWACVEMRAIFFHKQKRKRDGVNYNAMLKAAQDGIVDAGLVVDDDADHWTTLPPLFRIDSLSRVELTVSRIEYRRHIKEK